MKHAVSHAPLLAACVEDTGDLGRRSEGHVDQVGSSCLQDSRHEA